MDFEWRDKVAGNKIMFEDVCDPFGISFIIFLAANSIIIFEMGENNL